MRLWQQEILRFPGRLNIWDKLIVPEMWTRKTDLETSYPEQGAWRREPTRGQGARDEGRRVTRETPTRLHTWSKRNQKGSMWELSE